MATTEIQTFTFEGHYHDKDGGNRCDVVQAYNRDQALALAAIQMIDDNGWTDDPERYAGCANMAAVYEDEVHIDSEWRDLKGTACPNCTSHGGIDNGDVLAWTTGQAKVHECKACGYQWVPLGKKPGAKHPSSEEIDAEILERWRELCGISACRTVGCSADPDDGEGFDGFFGNCADKREPLFEDPKPMGGRGSSLLKSNRGEGFNFID